MRPAPGCSTQRDRTLHFAPQELRQRLDHQPVGLLGADAHAQGVRQPVGADLAQDQAALA